MRIFRTPSQSPWRFALALALLLAGLASARLQGAMAFPASGTLASAILCSSEGTSDDAGSAAGHVHCILCNLPLAAPALPPQARQPEALHLRPALPVMPDASAACAFCAYRSRAPPLNG